MMVHSRIRPSHDLEMPIRTVMVMFRLHIVARIVRITQEQIAKPQKTGLGSEKLPFSRRAVEVVEEAALPPLQSSPIVHIFRGHLMLARPANESRLSCGALKNNSFHNLRAPSASSACQAASHGITSVVPSAQLPPSWARHGDSISCLTSADKFNRRGGTAPISLLASSRQAAWSPRACSAASSGLIATWYKNPIRPEKSSTRTWASA